VGQILERYENRISIDGAVYRPGDYELTPDMTLYELIQKADGPTQDAFMSRGIIYRLKDDLSLETQSFDVRNLIMNRDEHDITLRRDDQVRITSIFDMREDYTINVSGAVNEGGDVIGGGIRGRDHVHIVLT
jgi:protein involved in polysaccharide export with SLBB domain